jgi:hypothetical protein
MLYLDEIQTHAEVKTGENTCMDLCATRDNNSSGKLLADR